MTAKEEQGDRERTQAGAVKCFTGLLKLDVNLPLLAGQLSLITTAVVTNI